MADNHSKGALELPTLPIRNSSRQPYAPGVTVEDGSTYKAYNGRREDLIACGIAKPQWFPGEPGQRKTVGRATMHDGKHVVIRASKLRFRAIIYRTEEEIQSARAREEARRGFAGAQRVADKALSSLPTSREDFREGELRWLARWVEGQRRIMSGVSGGFSFAPEVMLEFESAAEDLLDVLRNGAVLFSKKARAAEIEGLRATVSRADAPFQNFLQQAGANPKD